MKNKSCIEVVIVASDDAFLIWDSRGTNYVATDAESLQRWVLEIASDDDTPDVDFSAPRGGAWMQAAMKVVDTVSKKPAVEDAVGVHVVIQWKLEPWSAVVWPPKGGPRPAMTAHKLGEMLAQLARDPSQPRVQAGAPPDHSERLLEGVGELVSQWLKPGGHAA